MSNERIQQYVDQLNTRFKTGISSEHSYRGDLQSLIQDLCPGVLATNEPKRIKCGAPDYILTRKDIPLGHIEAKDIDTDLSHKKHKEQFDRYRKALPNLIITDYRNFKFYRDGDLVKSITIADVEDGRISGKAEQYSEFSNLITNFVTSHGQTIKSSKKLAEMMAGKARLLANVIENSLNDIKGSEDSALYDQLNAFRRILIHDIEPKEFADVYAQTITYGMFAARLHDPTLPTFSRQEAAELIPKSNPFLRKLFQYIAGYDLDTRLVWIVEDLADIFRATDIRELLSDFGKNTQQTDPIVHFYETFLAAYDPKLRKARGVWYTPEPVVKFIVRAVDDILKDEFGIKDGLASTEKIQIKTDSHVPDQRYESGYKPIEKEVHRVQVLDPATGTGTFLAETIRHIHKKFEGQAGIWSNYVENHLIPRLHGFEILMASYAMAHLKLEMLLSETGYKPTKNQRLKVYLTNALEEHHPDTGTLFSSWLSDEANEANEVKRDAPVMVILGNPPYSGESQNKGEWIMKLMEDYKKEPGGNEKLKERNPKWLNDDYVKFIRYASHLIEKNGEGVVAFINPHGFLDNPTFRGMRWHIFTVFDQVYVWDLHGNANKKEKSPDGSPDENVFDIQQGVSVNVFVKNGKAKKIFRVDSFGKRESKYAESESLRISSFSGRELPFNHESGDAYLEVNMKSRDLYMSWPSITDIFPTYSMGIVTSRDKFVVDISKEELSSRINSAFMCDNFVEYIAKVGIKENKSWNLKDAVMKSAEARESDFCKIDYRPFDLRNIYYDENFIERSRRASMKHMKSGNLGIVFRRQQPKDFGLYVFICSNLMADGYIRSDNKGGESVAPLLVNGVANINEHIATEIWSGYANRSPTRHEDIFYYVYAVMHSNRFRDEFENFLKTDYPRIAFPKSHTSFASMSILGKSLAEVHLLESTGINEFITQYPIDGTNEITRKMTKRSVGYEPTSDAHGRVWINDEQFFDGVPLLAWEFYIGGYQPAQKWLKDRNGRTLSFEDIQHYQKIIVALVETNRIMDEIDKIDFF